MGMKKKIMNVFGENGISRKKKNIKMKE